MLSCLEIQGKRVNRPPYPHIRCWGIKTPAGWKVPDRVDRTWSWVAPHSRCVSDLDTTIPLHLSRYSRKTHPPTTPSSAARYTVRNMAGTKGTRNRSESQEQDEVRTQLTLFNTLCDAEAGLSSSRTITPRTKNTRWARQNLAGKRIRSTARFLLVLGSFF